MFSFLVNQIQRGSKSKFQTLLTVDNFGAAFFEKILSNHLFTFSSWETKTLTSDLFSCIIRWFSINQRLILTT